MAEFLLKCAPPQGAVPKRVPETSSEPEPRDKFTLPAGATWAEVPCTGGAH